jgi:hypothetical protein
LAKDIVKPPPRNIPVFNRVLYVWAPWFDKMISSDLIITVRDENIQCYRAMGRSVDVRTASRFSVVQFEYANCLLISIYRRLSNQILYKEFNLLKPKTYYMYRQFNIQHFHVLPTQCICFVWIWKRSDYFPIQH